MPNASFEGVRSLSLYFDNGQGGGDYQFVTVQQSEMFISYDDVANAYLDFGLPETNGDSTNYPLDPNYNGGNFVTGTNNVLFDGNSIDGIRNAISYDPLYESAVDGNAEDIDLSSGIQQVTWSYDGSDYAAVILIVEMEIPDNMRLEYVYVLGGDPLPEDINGIPFYTPAGFSEFVDTENYITGNIAPDGDIDGIQEETQIFIANLSGGTSTNQENNGDVILGGDADNHFTYIHEDQLNGTSGNDTIKSGGGWDFINASEGDDTIRGGGGTDTVSYQDWGEAVDVNLATGIATDGSQSFTDRLFSIEKVRGSGFADTLTGSDERNIFRAMQGNDTIDGGKGRDQVRYDRDNGDGVIVDLAAGTATDEWDSTDSLTNIEDIRGSKYDDAIFGSKKNNRLEGRDGNDFLEGRNGDDRLEGGDGADLLLGGNGDDDLTGGSGRDEIRGGNDSDFIDGGGANDKLYGGNGDDDIFGGNGKDKIWAGGGEDDLWGGVGADTFFFGNNSGTNTIHDFDIDTDILNLKSTGITQSSSDTDVTVVQRGGGFEGQEDGIVTFGTTTITFIGVDVDAIQNIVFADEILA